MRFVAGKLNLSQWMLAGCVCVGFTVVGCDKADPGTQAPSDQGRMDAGTGDASHTPDGGAPDQSQPQASVIMDDNVASEAISSQVEIAVGALSEDASDAVMMTAIVVPESSEKGASPDGEVGIKAGLRCVENVATGGVSIVKTVNGDAVIASKDKKGNPVTDTVHESLSETQTWQKGPMGMAIKCNGNGTARVGMKSPTYVAGVVMQSMGTDSRSDAKVKGTTPLSSRTTMSSSTRQVTWDRPTLAVDFKSITGSKAISFTVDHSLTTKDQKGQDVSVNMQVKTDPAAALKEVTVRPTTGDDWTSKTIVQGGVVSTLKDGSRIQLSYGNVKLLSSSEQRCLPVEGQIDGKIFAKDGTTPLKTFQIKFGQMSDSTVTVAFGDPAGQTFGQAQDFPHYKPAVCPL